MIKATVIFNRGFNKQDPEHDYKGYDYLYNPAEHSVKTIDVGDIATVITTHRQVKGLKQLSIVEVVAVEDACEADKLHLKKIHQIIKGF